MTPEEQKIIDTSLDQARALHDNMRGMWDGDTLATFYYSVISGTMARSGPEVAKALSAMLTEVYANTAKSHVDLGKLANGFAGGGQSPAASANSEAGAQSTMRPFSARVSLMRQYTTSDSSAQAVTYQ